MIGGANVKKIVIHIQNNILYFSYKHGNTVRDDLMNTNIISDSEIVFSDDYIEQNQTLVIPFFKELCTMNHIDTLTFQNSDLAFFLIDLFKNLKIRTIKIKKEAPIPYLLCEKIPTLKSVRELYCYSIANYMLDYLDKYKITVKSNAELLTMSCFMIHNNLKSYTDMYYKKQITIYQKLKEEDKEDLNNFLKLNQYLRIIHLQVLYLEDLKYLAELLETYRLRRIIIKLYANISNLEQVEYLKNMNKKFKKDKISVELVYSKEYIENNLMKQISLNTLKLCGFILIAMIVGTISYIAYDNYNSLQEVTAIQEKVHEIIAKKEEDIELPPEKKQEELTIKNKYIASLLSINQDVVGYLKVNNTNVDYPVVLGQDNKHYLDKNLYNQEDKNGWIFMDFRNSDKILNDNTIIYGHNRYYSDIMFGSLKSIIKPEWYNNEENMIIEFDTMYETMKWKVFSIYTLPKTSDYLKVSFTSKESKQAYIDMVKGRSVKDFGTEVTTDDIFLTLSTCNNYDKRLVLHAKLIKEE